MRDSWVPAVCTCDLTWSWLRAPRTDGELGELLAQEEELGTPFTFWDLHLFSSLGPLISDVRVWRPSVSPSPLYGFPKHLLARAPGLNPANHDSFYHLPILLGKLWPSVTWGDRCERLPCNLSLCLACSLTLVKLRVG